MSDNPAVELAKVSSTLEHLIKVVENDAVSRKEIYRTLHDIDKKVDHTIYRINTLEGEFREAAPTIDEWIATKHKIQGAGWLGKTLWIIGGFLLGAAASTYGAISALWK